MIAKMPPLALAAPRCASALLAITLAAALATASAAVGAPVGVSAAGGAEGQRVTVDNFKRAETENYFAAYVAGGAFGRFAHARELTPVDEQTVIRMNRDTLYSVAVFDLDAAPVTITLPDLGGRFMSMQVVDQDHYTTMVVYGGRHTLTRQSVGTRYVAALVRTFMDPGDPQDVAAARKLQDAIEVSQASQGVFEPTEWDQDSLTRMRDAINNLVEANGGLDSARMFGGRDEVDPVQHLLGTAAGWGGNPREAAMYVGGAPERNDGATAYTLTLRDVPVDGFWSICVYNQAGFFEPNERGVYSINSVTARPEADGSFIVRFGGDLDAPNAIPITPGWNYVLRLYRPRPEVLDGSWKAPTPEPVG